MTNVQAVRPNGKFGGAGAGLEPECRDGNYEMVFPICPSNVELARLQQEGSAEWLSLCLPPTFKGTLQEYLETFVPLPESATQKQ